MAPSPKGQSGLYAVDRSNLPLAICHGFAVVQIGQTVVYALLG